MTLTGFLVTVEGHLSGILLSIGEKMKKDDGDDGDISIVTNCQMTAPEFCMRKVILHDI